MFAANKGMFGAYDTVPKWEDRLNRQLLVATREFTAFESMYGFSSSQRTFNKNNFSMKTLSSVPLQKTKGYNCLVTSRFLYHKLLENRDPSCEEQEVMIATLYCWIRWIDIAHEAGRSGSILLQDSHIEELKEARRGGLSGFKWLSRNASVNGLHRFNVVPKLHSLDHAIRRSIRTGISFAAFWTFSQEDFMGLSARLTSKIHASAICVRSVDRWLSGFKVGWSASESDADMDC